MSGIGEAYARVPQTSTSPSNRVSIDGRLFQVNRRAWYVKGYTYGPFKPNSDGHFLPERDRMLADFALMRSCGCNAIRLYHTPPPQLLDDALAHDLRVLIDVPWEKHRCFFEDWSAQRDAVDAVRRTAKRFRDHPGIFAISVANEIPHDIVRFYGAARVEHFIEKLVDTARAEAPDCLITYTNYPSTEFLLPRNLDFYCANVYLHDGETLGRYLDRLQHVAGHLPLLLGEYGVDTLRNGEDQQCGALRSHLQEVFRRGLAGSFVFSFTDDWFTGGHQIQDWAFGVTRADRSLKPAATVVSKLWADVPKISDSRFPRVSVVVCTYQGGATLDECLASLQKLDYPDYEVIVIDDGSTDRTREIASKYPECRYHYQSNQGLSAARNEGARLATGQIVAYTDSDCVADRHWLLYLTQAMEDQHVEAVGGPNISPDSDRWTAKCVAASPGGPSHVMLDDQRAEHVPGCNMAFRRDKLLEVGGFDAQFRQAGDDVDICWRFLDAGMSIGYAPSALVWHHRRNTVSAYFKQQAGYGRSEAMLRLKHPQRFNRLGYSQWLGVIYGEGAVGLPLCRPSIYHGKFGAGLFQIIYRRNDYHLGAYFTLFEWNVLAVLVLLLAPVWWPAALVSAGMWTLTLATAAWQVAHVRLPKSAPTWCWPLTYWMHLVQPIVRGNHRYKHLLINARTPVLGEDSRAIQRCSKATSRIEHELCWTTDAGRGREHLLPALVALAHEMHWNGDFRNEWEAHDVELVGDLLHNIRICTATEELGWPKRFTRVRCSVQPTGLAMLVASFITIWTTLAFFGDESGGALIMGGIAAAAALAALRLSRWRCRQAVSALVYRAGLRAKLNPAVIRSGMPDGETGKQNQQDDDGELAAYAT